MLHRMLRAHLLSSSQSQQIFQLLWKLCMCCYSLPFVSSCTMVLLIYCITSQFHWFKDKQILCKFGKHLFSWIFYQFSCLSWQVCARLFSVEFSYKCNEPRAKLISWKSKRTVFHFLKKPIAIRRGHFRTGFAPTMNISLCSAHWEICVDCIFLVYE